MSRQRTHAGIQPQKAEGARPVSKQDRHEREAERAADVVARGGSVAGWSFSAVPPSAAAPIQRQEVVKEKTEEEKRNEALKKAGEAALETPEGKALKEKVLADPVVKTVKDAVTSTPGLIVSGIAAAGGVAALAATGKELPFQPPEIPLEKVSPKLAGVSAQVTYEGPVNNPTFVGLSITVKEQGPKEKGKKKPDPIAADIARLKAQEEMFRKGMTYAPGSKEAEEQRLLDQAVSNWVLRGATVPGLTIPLTPPKPKEEKKEKEKPAQPAPASSASAPPAHANVDDALSATGRPLDASTRRAMEARFGYDFSGVRVHDDARASATAAGIDAAAFTVGEDVVFAAGRYDPSTPAGRRLLGHELAHVVQQTEPDRGDGAGPLRKTAGRPLDPKLREYFEPRLGTRFGDVRIHADADAASAARRLRARAYTVASDVVCGEGEYDPDTSRGRWLLAHELAHVAQSRRVAGEGGTPAVERDASAAAGAAVSGRPVRLRARRSGAEPDLFGEPDQPPDLTFVSTQGKPGFLNQATQFHTTWGLAPRRFSSMQALLATLAQSTGTIGRLRIVSHADFDNIFTSFFAGGPAGITEEELRVWAESDVAGLRRALNAPLIRQPTFTRQVLTRARAADSAVFTAFGLDPANPPTTGPVAQLIDASVDLLAVRSATGLPAVQKTRFEAALTAELAALRAQVAVRAPGATGPTAVQAQALQDAITGVANVNVQLPVQDPQVMARIARETAAVTQGFRRNLDAVRARLPSSSFVDIRGCRVGQRPPYLAAVKRFFTSANGGPTVSGPDIWQSYPRLGWHPVADRDIRRRAAQPLVKTALAHWAEVTGIRTRLTWWLRFLGRVLVEDAAQKAAQNPSLLTPPALGGGLTLRFDPLIDTFSGELPPLPRLEEPALGLGRTTRAPALATTPALQNPLVPLAQREIAKYGGADGELRYYLDSALPLPVQEGANVEMMSLLLKAGLEREAIHAWIASEWSPAAPALADILGGAWTRDAIRQVEAVVDMDDRRRARAMYVSPDPRYAAHIKRTP
jgi:Domain of unknown function (DUF4157)